MNLDGIVDMLRKIIDKVTHSEWLSVALTILVVVAVTALVTNILSRILRTLLTKGKGPLPSSSIFVNILRVTTWTIAICVILSSCFNVNVGALVTALGVGGIAVSLGAQSLLSNLIGGLQVSLTGLVKPGDRIQVNNQSGTVRDVTWSHTSLDNANGEHVVIPNSVITSVALIHLLPANKVKIPLYVTTIPQQGGLTQLVHDAEEAVNKALDERFIMKKPATIMFSGNDRNAMIGTLAFEVADRRDANDATDLAMRIVAPYAHADNIVETQAETDIEGVVTSTENLEEVITEEKKSTQKRVFEKQKQEKAAKLRDQQQRPHHRLFHRLHPRRLMKKRPIAPPSKGSAHPKGQKDS